MTRFLGQRFVFKIAGLNESQQGIAEKVTVLAIVETESHLI